MDARGRLMFIVYAVVGIPLAVYAAYVTRGYALAVLVPVFLYLVFLIVRWAIRRVWRRDDGD